MEAQPREVVFYVTNDDECPFERWLEALRDRQARAKIKARLDRVELGNLGDFKPVGEGVMEFRVDYGQVIGFTLPNREQPSFFCFAEGIKRPKPRSRYS